MLADLERATFSNIEHQSLEFIRDTIRPWLVRWEQALTRDLIPPADRDTYFVEFLIDGLMRGDLKSRYDSYAIGRNNGWLSANDIRRLENMNPLPPEQGDIYLIPLNMVQAGTAAPKPADEAQPVE
jgi:HK97 family phage portal protein